MQVFFRALDLLHLNMAQIASNEKFRKTSRRMHAGECGKKLGIFICFSSALGGFALLHMVQTHTHTRTTYHIYWHINVLEINESSIRLYSAHFTSEVALFSCSSPFFFSFMCTISSNPLVFICFHVLHPLNYFLIVLSISLDFWNRKAKRKEYS